MPSAGKPGSAECGAGRLHWIPAPADGAELPDTVPDAFGLRFDILLMIKSPFQHDFPLTFPLYHHLRRGY